MKIFRYAQVKLTISTNLLFVHDVLSILNRNSLILIRSREVAIFQSLRNLFGSYHTVSLLVLSLARESTKMMEKRDKFPQSLQFFRDIRNNFFLRVITSSMQNKTHKIVEQGLSYNDSRVAILIYIIICANCKRRYYIMYNAQGLKRQ